jgi:integrase
MLALAKSIGRRADRAVSGRHAHAVEVAREGVPLIVIQRQLGHSNLGITSVYLHGIDSGENIETVHARRAAMIPVSTFGCDPPPNASLFVAHWSSETLAS